MTQGNVVDDDFPGFSPDLGVRMAVFRVLGAYGKEACKMSENQVVAQPLNHGLAMALLKSFPRFNIQFISLKSRTVALKSRIKFLRSSSAI